MVRPLHIALALIAALCQAGVIVGSVVHEASTVHVVCEDHGHVLELDDHHEAPFEDGLSAGEHDEHEHGCAFAGAGFGADVPAHTGVALPQVPPLVAVSTVSPDAPRGPPLAFAPKTSPPSC